MAYNKLSPPAGHMLVCHSAECHNDPVQQGPMHRAPFHRRKPIKAHWEITEVILGTLLEKTQASKNKKKQNKNQITKCSTYRTENKGLIEHA